MVVWVEVVALGLGVVGVVGVVEVALVEVLGDED